MQQHFAALRGEVAQHVFEEAVEADRDAERRARAAQPERAIVRQIRRCELEHVHLLLRQVRLADIVHNRAAGQA